MAGLDNHRRADRLFAKVFSDDALLHAQHEVVAHRAAQHPALPDELDAARHRLLDDAIEPPERVAKVGAERVVGDPGPGVADDLGVAGLEAQHAQGVDARVDAGDHGELAGGPAGHARVTELLLVLPVRFEKIVEH